MLLFHYMVIITLMQLNNLNEIFKVYLAQLIVLNMLPVKTLKSNY